MVEDDIAARPPVIEDDLDTTYRPGGAAPHPRQHAENPEHQTTSHRLCRPPGEAAKEENKSVNRIRQVVERTIAHIKSWRIHPHCLQETPGNIRADDHRSTRILHLQNHPLNKFPRRARHTGGDY